MRGRAARIDGGGRRPAGLGAAGLTVVAPLLLSACAHSGPAPTAACTPDPSGQPPVASAVYQDRTIDELKSLASDGDRAAARVVGERYQRGIGVASDMKMAADWYQRAAFTGPSTMKVYMPGYGKVSGTTLTVPGPSLPGDPIAMAHLGWLYIDGDALPFDELRGRELLACAAARGANANNKSALKSDQVNHDTEHIDHG
jgi:TPR repeat protein